MESLDIGIWYEKYKLFSIQKAKSQSAMLNIFVQAMSQLTEDLSQFQNLVEILLLNSNGSNKNICLKTFGCFDSMRSHILYLNKQIKIELHKVEINPRQTIFSTCKFANVSQIFVNKENGCDKTRKIESQDYFYT